jgi:fimbrial isopeptide formation D2 family protein/LPXTG-motif cell wall-anchored protein
MATKAFTRATALVLAAATLLSLVLPLSFLGFPATATAAPDASKDGQASVTVHKYRASSASAVPGTGQVLSAAEAAKLGTPLKDAGFSLYAISGTITDAMALDPSTIPTGQLTLVGTEKFTDATGQADWQNLAFGYYLLKETTVPTGSNVVASAPSIISVPFGYNPSDPNGWTYDIHVYPKNVSNEKIEKQVLTPNTFYNLGDEITWRIDAKLPSPIRDGAPGAYTYGSMLVTDPLDGRLDYKTSSTEIYALGGNSAPLLLSEGSDYTLTAPSIATSNTISWELTQAGIDKVADDSASSLNIRFITTINATAFAASPAATAQISNGAAMEFKDTNSSNTSTAQVPNDKKPKIDLAHLEISKVDNVDATLLLDGARFGLAATKADAENNVFIKDSAGKDVVLTTGDNPLTSAIEKGYGIFSGLDIDKSYFLTELKAPSKADGNTYDYVLRPDVIEVKITVADNGHAIVTIQNTRLGTNGPGPNFKLPTTGGIGTLIFSLIGGALMLTALIVAAAKRRRREEEERSVQLSV